MIYYWESDHNNGQFSAESDEEALKQMKDSMENKFLLVLYREDQESEDGAPFVILYERD